MHYERIEQPPHNGSKILTLTITRIHGDYPLLKADVYINKIGVLYPLTPKLLNVHRVQQQQNYK